MNKEDKIKIATEFYSKLNLENQTFEFERDEEIKADYVWIPDTRGPGGLIIGDDGSYLFCQSAHGFSYWKEEFKSGKRSNNERSEFEEKFEIKLDGELKEILLLCKDEPIFFGEEKRLLSISEIMNCKEELNLKENVIPIIDLYDNNFVVYDISNNQFIKFDISEEVSFGKIDSIRAICVIIGNARNRNYPWYWAFCVFVFLLFSQIAIEVILTR